jgi:hypothetical protein
MSRSGLSKQGFINCASSLLSRERLLLSKPLCNRLYELPRFRFFKQGLGPQLQQVNIGSQFFFIRTETLQESSGFC